MADLKELLKESDARIDAIVLDPREAAKEGRDAVVNQALTGIPADIAADLLRSPLREYDDQIRAGFENGNYGVRRQALSDLQTALRNTIRNERNHGKLRPITAETELERCKDFIRSRRWDGGAEHDNLLQMIKPGEKIQSIEFWKIILDTSREIGRGDVRAWGKPLTWSNRSGSWESQFVSDAEVREAEESAARQAASASARSAYNTFYPNGVRP